MIPATSWADQGNGTAWWYIEGPERWGWMTLLDRPCDTCGGDSAADWSVGLPECDCINGRHTFTLDVACAGIGKPRRCGDRITASTCAGCDRESSRSLRVSVVPDMILPIYDKCPDYNPPNHLCQCYGDGKWYWHLGGPEHERAGTSDTERPVTLPSDAKPGGFAVLVNWRPA